MAKVLHGYLLLYLCNLIVYGGVLCADASMPELQHFSLHAFMLPPIPHTVHCLYVELNSRVPFYEAILLDQNCSITLVFVTCSSVKSLCSDLSAVS